jgi:hypothetical protein
MNSNAMLRITEILIQFGGAVTKLHKFTGPHGFGTDYTSWAIVTGDSQAGVRINIGGDRHGQWEEWRERRDGMCRLHRTDGPAVVEYHGSMSWWLHGQKQPNI